MNEKESKTLNLLMNFSCKPFDKLGGSYKRERSIKFATYIWLGLKKNLLKMEKIKFEEEIKI